MERISKERLRKRINMSEVVLEREVLTNLEVLTTESCEKSELGHSAYNTKCLLINSVPLCYYSQNKKRWKDGM